MKQNHKKISMDLIYLSAEENNYYYICQSSTNKRDKRSGHNIL